jgi:hypothetical protein
MMDFDLAMKIYQSIRLEENLSEHQKKMAVRFAYDSGEETLTSRLISEMLRGEIPDEELIKEYSVYTDKQPKWAKDLSELILTLGTASIEQEQILKEVNKRLEETLWQMNYQRQSR